MSRIAFVFPGQGAQYRGMGFDLYSNIPAAAEVYKRADELRPGTSGQCFTGTEEELAKTANTQPCIYVTELAAAAALNSVLSAAALSIKPEMTAGFSLGEVTALTYTQAVSFDTGFRLVCHRGLFMQEEAENFDGAMAAVLKLDTETVERLCAKYKHVYPVNYNCPGQISVSGLASELAEFIKDVKIAGGRAVPLKVKGGFHSPLMNNAAVKFGALLNNTDFSRPSIPLYSNCTALPYTDDYRGLLSRQISEPVRWQSIIENMISRGIDTFIELGPGKTLCGLISKINSDVRTLHVEDMITLEETAEVIRNDVSTNR